MKGIEYEYEEEEEEHWIIEVWTWRLDRGSMSGTGFNPGLANIDLEIIFDFSPAETLSC